jgi:hypothetical protein
VKINTGRGVNLRVHERIHFDVLERGSMEEIFLSFNRRKNQNARTTK